MTREETEVKKNIEWLKSAIQQNLDFYNDKDEEWQMAKVRAYAKSLDLINQLDEPEVLSDKWIDDNSVYASSDGITEEYVHVDELKELLVPKQEVLSQEWIDENKSLINGRSTNPDGTEGECYDAHYIHVLELQNLLVPKQELPVIPKFVADWIEVCGGYYKPSFLALGYDLYSENITYPEVDKWIADNQELFARAWLDGYEVEKDQKYILSINITDKASKTNYETFLNKRGIFHSMENASFNSEEFSWTEEEIKALESGEILFEHFATKIEELEE